MRLKALIQAELSNTYNVYLRLTENFLRASEVMGYCENSAYSSSKVQEIKCSKYDQSLLSTQQDLFFHKKGRHLASWVLQRPSFGIYCMFLFVKMILRVLGGILLYRYFEGTVDP